MGTLSIKCLQRHSAASIVTHFVVMLTVVILTVIILTVVILTVITLTVIILTVIILTIITLTVIILTVVILTVFILTVVILTVIILTVIYWLSLYWLPLCWASRHPVASSVDLAIYHLDEKILEEVLSSILKTIYDHSNCHYYTVGALSRRQYDFLLKLFIRNDISNQGRLQHHHN